MHQRRELWWGQPRVRPGEQTLRALPGHGRLQHAVCVQPFGAVLRVAVCRWEQHELPRLHRELPGRGVLVVQRNRRLCPGNVVRPAAWALRRVPERRTLRGPDAAVSPGHGPL